MREQTELNKKEVRKSSGVEISRTMIIFIQCFCTNATVIISFQVYLVAFVFLFSQRFLVAGLKHRTRRKLAGNGKQIRNTAHMYASIYVCMYVYK